MTNLYKVLTPLFEFEIFLVESDSNDNSMEILDRLEIKFDFFTYVSLGDLEETIPNRIDRLIFCRNRYINEIRSNLRFRNAQYILMIDLDNRNSMLNTNSIRRSIENSRDWAALFCNQKGRYYDILALRHPFWCPRSVWEEISWLSKIVSKGEAKKIAVHSRMIKVPSHSDLIPVQSAYGGLAIYKTSYLLDHDFSREPNDSLWDIDFVILNRKIIRSGGKLFIDPQLINLRWNHHSLDYFRVYRYSINWVKRLRSARRKVAFH